MLFPLSIHIDRPRPLRRFFAGLRYAVSELASDRQWFDDVQQIIHLDAEPYDKIARLSASTMAACQRLADRDDVVSVRSFSNGSAPCSSCMDFLGTSAPGEDAVVLAGVAAHPELAEDVRSFNLRHGGHLPADALRSYAAGWMARWIREGKCTDRFDSSEVSMARIGGVLRAASDSWDAVADDVRRQLLKHLVAELRREGWIAGPGDAMKHERPAPGARWGYDIDSVHVHLEDRSGSIAWGQLALALLGSAGEDAILWSRDSGGWTVHAWGRSISVEFDFDPGVLEALIAFGILVRMHTQGTPLIDFGVSGWSDPWKGITVRRIGDGYDDAEEAAADDLGPATVPDPNDGAAFERLGGLARRPDGTLASVSLLSTDSMYRWGCEIGDVVLSVDGHPASRVPDDVLDRLEASRVIVSRRGSVIAYPITEFQDHPDDAVRAERMQEVFAVSFQAIRSDPDSFAINNRLEGPTPEIRPELMPAQADAVQDYPTPAATA